MSSVENKIKCFENYSLIDSVHSFQIIFFLNITL